MSEIDREYKIGKKHNGDYSPDASGDYLLIGGVENVRQRAYNRLITIKGSVVHRPDFGVGLSKYQNIVLTLDNQRQLALDINQQLPEDPNISQVEKVSIKQETNQDEELITKVSVSFVIEGYGSTILDVEV